MEVEEEREMTWPHSNVPSLCFRSLSSLSTKRRRISLARTLPACCQHRKPAALNTIAANHFHSHSLRHRQPPPTPPPPPQHHPPPRHPRNLSPRQQTTPRQVSVANGISCALTSTSFVARQTPARHAEPRCSHTCDDTIQRIPTENQRASFRGYLLAKDSRAALL